MIFNCEEENLQRSKNSLKWNTADSSVLPMWVAEMDFRWANCIQEAVLSAVSSGELGYYKLHDEFFLAIQNWLRKRQKISVESSQILPISGMMATIVHLIKMLSEDGDSVIIQPPVYNQFSSVIQYCGRKVVENNLELQNNFYTVNFKDLQEKIINTGAKILLLCNPQNPVGKVWQETELLEMAKLCKAFGVIIISDEMHADLSFKKFTSFYKIAQQTEASAIVLQSPCKTFNFPGLPVGFVLSEQTELLENLRKNIEKSASVGINAISAAALQSAYNFGENWLDEVKTYIESNFDFLENYLKTHIPEIKVLPVEATYLVWLDCRVFQKKSDDMIEELHINHHLLLNSGSIYGNAGDGFLRMNIACTKKNLAKALERLQNFAENNLQ